MDSKVCLSFAQATDPIEVRFMDMSIEGLKRTYKDEWILAEVLEVDEEGAPKRVKLN